MCPSGRYRDDRSSSPDLRPAFDILDADRDGRISRDDLKAFYNGQTAAAPLTDDDIASMISAADADRNGFVDYGEFESVLLGRLMGTRGGGAAGSVMEEAFRVMDRDGDGKVGFGDLKAYLEWAGMPVADEEIRAMIRMGGGDEADGVSFEGLAEILAVDFAKGA